jgi:putative tryptophan/tyrosine transport system substrate-binding protein
MRRRELFALIGVTAATWPFSRLAEGQGRRDISVSPPVIGFLNSASPEPFAAYVSAFKQGLEYFGYRDGGTVAIDYRWARGQTAQLAEDAKALVRRPVDVIVATGGEHAARAAKAATSNIPIVFSVGQDPVKTGLVSGLNRPGANLTGVAVLTAELEPKRLGLLCELLPHAQKLCALVDSTYDSAESQQDELRSAARALGKDVVVLKASNDGEIAAAFTRVTEEQAEGIVIASSVYFNSRREHIIALAARVGVPAIYQWREFAVAGGLMSYGANLADMYQQVGVYTGRILRGVAAADLPIYQPTKFELLLNLKTAKSLGITIPARLLALANEVIE